MKYFNSKERVPRIVNYAGSKDGVTKRHGYVLQTAMACLNDKIKHYSEPFAGTGVLGFNLIPHAKQLGLETVTFSDTNKHLVEFYNAIKEDPETVKKKFAKYLHRLFDREYFNQLKREFNETKNSILLMILVDNSFGNMMILDAEDNYKNGFDSKRWGKTTTAESILNRKLDALDAYHELLNSEDVEVKYICKNYYDRIKEIELGKDCVVVLDPPYDTSTVDYSQNNKLVKLNRDILKDMSKLCDKVNFLSFDYIAREDTITTSMIDLLYTNCLHFQMFLTNQKFQIQRNRKVQNGVEGILTNMKDPKFDFNI